MEEYVIYYGTPKHRSLAQGMPPRAMPLLLNPKGYAPVSPETYVSIYPHPIKKKAKVLSDALNFFPKET